MRWPWSRKNREPHAEAIEAIARGERKLSDEMDQLPRAEDVAARSRRVGERNGFAESWAAALAANRSRVEDS